MKPELITQQYVIEWAKSVWISVALTAGTIASSALIVTCWVRPDLITSFFVSVLMRGTN